MKQPWIGRPIVDILFILAPPFLSLAIIMMFPEWFVNNKDLPDAAWVVLILLIDVAHVYSTLYRTYFDPYALRNQRFLLWMIPFGGFVAGVLIYSISDHLFWRLLAYVAVFHFVRQQYGFMRVYSRFEKVTSRSKRIDSCMIYAASVYPLLFWHLKGPRNFSWFVEGDFLFFEAGWLLQVAGWLYFLIIAVYVGKEIRQLVRGGSFNLPKQLVVIGTAMSWYFGIVYFNGDLAFTLLNVVSHGVPYMALVWITGEKSTKKQPKRTWLSWLYSPYGIALFLLIIFVFAFVEEGLWDMFLWQEHQRVFGISKLPDIALNKQLLSILVPLLALPQITHYIMDGFIWKVRPDGFAWKKES